MPPHYGDLLALISRGRFYVPTYLWLWNKILTHLNFSSKGLLPSVRGHLKIQLLALSSHTLQSLSQELDSDLNLPIYHVSS